MRITRNIAVSPVRCIQAGLYPSLVGQNFAIRL
jgi:hypothetical protein